jgi:hypothetical protein
MPQPPGTRNDNPFAGSRLDHLKAFVSGDPGADQRSCILWAQTRRDVGDKVGICDDIFGKPAIFGLGADSFPFRQAMFTMPAGRIKSGHADPVAFFDNCDAGAEGGYPTNAFMTRNERRCRLDRPVAFGGMQAGMANAAGFGLDQELT